MEYFQTMIGREIDKFDPNLKYFYEKPTRPLGKTVKEIVEIAPDGTKFK